MNILLISQCDKRALTETRRILDQFAERRGDRTWQTPITQDGLDTLRRLLRATARKNTAVCLSWFDNSTLQSGPNLSLVTWWRVSNSRAVLTDVLEQVAHQRGGIAATALGRVAPGLRPGACAWAVAVGQLQERR